MAFRLIIFDLDGTLVDSLEDLADSMNAVLASRGFPTHPVAPYQRFVGDGIATLVRRALPSTDRGDDLIASCVLEMRQEYAGRQLAKTRPYPGVAELLRSLAERGLKTAVFSNKPDGPTREVVAALFAAHPFDAVRGARPDAPLKPDPTVALQLAGENGEAPEETVYVGDTDTDMLTGQRAGMFTVGVTWGFRGEEELRASGADSIVHKPLELLRLFTDIRNL